MRSLLFSGTRRVKTEVGRCLLVQSSLWEKYWEMGKKAAESEGTVVCLLPARTDTKWFHEYINGKAEIRFVKGRLKFGGSKNSAPFPSMIVIFRQGEKNMEDLYIRIANEADRTAVAIALIKNGYIVSLGKRKDENGKNVSVIVYREK